MLNDLRKFEIYTFVIHFYTCFSLPIWRMMHSVIRSSISPAKLSCQCGMIRHLNSSMHWPMWSLFHVSLCASCLAKSCCHFSLSTWQAVRINHEQWLSRMTGGLMCHRRVNIFMSEGTYSVVLLEQTLRHKPPRSHNDRLKKKKPWRHCVSLKLSPTAALKSLKTFTPFS